MTIADIESRLTALEDEIVLLRQELERERIREGIRRGREDVAQGRVVPAREALEALRQKYNIPAT